MRHDRSEFGFWRAVSRLNLGQIFSLANVFAIVVGTGAGIAAAHFTDTTARVGIADDFKSLSGSLVGIVFSGFALVVGLMSDRYAVWLSRGPNGIKGFLSPFLISVGLLLTTLVLVITYRALAKLVPLGLEQVLFSALCVIFLAAVLDVIALAKTVLAHGTTRAESAEIAILEEEAKRLRQRGEQS